MNKEKNFVSAVVYLHNGEGRIGPFLERLTETLETNFEHTELICVNDASEDRGVEEVRSAAGRSGSCSVSILNMSYYHGLELAMNAGVDLAIGDFVFEFDTLDTDYGEKEILAVYQKALEGYDIVSAVPDRKQRLSSRLFYRVLNHFAEFPYKLTTESFRILSRRVINRISSINKTVPYRKAVYANCGLKTARLSYAAAGPAPAQDAAERRYRRRLAVDALILFSNLGYRFSFAMTALMMGISAFMCVYSLAVYLLKNPVEGWTTTILFLSVALFGVFAVLTVIIKYLQILVDLVFKRKHYSFESLEKLSR